MSEDHKPVIVLVRPQLGQNIGKSARAMLNFGLSEMRLVAPRDGWPNPDAGPSASGADEVLEQAQLFDTVEEAVADCAFVYASTVRRRDLVMPVIDPAQMADRIAASNQRSAILFGPERWASRPRRWRWPMPSSPSRSIPNSPRSTWPRRSSCWRTNGRGARAWPSRRPRISRNRAPHGELDGLIRQLDEALSGKGYFHPPSRTQATRNTIRTIFTKTAWSSREVKAVREIIRALVEPPRKR